MAHGDAADGYAGLGAREGSAKGRGNISGRLDRLASIRPFGPGSLLDVGCGNGAYTVELAASFDRVVGIDIEPDRLADFRSTCDLPHVEVIERSAVDTGFDTATFDAVVAIETVEHLGDVLGDVLREVARVLVPGGVFYLTTPNRWWPLEQHGWVWRGRRRPGWSLPFLTWFPAVHRRLSQDAVFVPDQLDRHIEPLGFRRIGLVRMMPPLDGSPSLRRWIGPALRRLERSPLRGFGQTLVMAYERVG